VRSMYTSSHLYHILLKPSFSKHALSSHCYSQTAVPLQNHVLTAQFSVQSPPRTRTNPHLSLESHIRIKMKSAGLASLTSSPAHVFLPHTLFCCFGLVSVFVHFSSYKQLTSMVSQMLSARRQGTPECCWLGITHKVLQSPRELTGAQLSRWTLLAADRT
jgi:hypothetical protein